MVHPRTRRTRTLRRNATRAERVLWRALRAIALPVRVRRQHPIGRYIADFAVPSRRLVIEIDGGQHATAVARDAARTRELEAKGWRVIRFWNSDVMSNLEGVIETIVAEIERTPSSPRPSPPPRAGGAEPSERSERPAIEGKRTDHPSSPRPSPPQGGEGE